MRSDIEGCSCCYGVRDNLGLSSVISAGSKAAALRKYRAHFREVVEEAPEEHREAMSRFVEALGEPRAVFLKCAECTCG